ncbi:Cysteine proteinase RD21A, partial [Mucuna pruriens]
MEASYPTKNGLNHPNPDPSPRHLQPLQLYVMNIILAILKPHGYCPNESATCYDVKSSCCPPEFSICDTQSGTYLLSRDNPLGVKALSRTPATNTWSLRKVAMKSI